MILSDKMVEVVRHSNKVVYEDADHIIKVFNDDKLASEILNESLNLARVSEAGVRTPKFVEAAECESGWAIMTTKIPGITLEQKMADCPEQADKLLDQFVDLMLDIHKHRSPLLQRQKDKYARMINELKSIDATTRYELLTRLDGMKPHTKICHGDFNPSNVIVAEDGQLYVCDWAHATQGNGSADAAMTYLLFAMKDKALADKFLDVYCAKCDSPKQLVHQWMPIVAAAELSRGRKEGADFLASWLQIGDFQ